MKVGHCKRVPPEAACFPSSAAAAKLLAWGSNGAWQYPSGCLAFFIAFVHIASLQGLSISLWGRWVRNCLLLQLDSGVHHQDVLYTYSLPDGVIFENGNFGGRRWLVNTDH